MTLRPIPGAPIGAPIPDFPTGEPGPLFAPASSAPSPSAPLPVSSVPLPVRRSGPVEVRGDGDSTLTLRCIPEIPAINRSSMTISITGERSEDYSPLTMPHLDLATDKARAFLLALRDGVSGAVVADSRTGFQLHFAITEVGPMFTVSRPGHERTIRNFIAGGSGDVTTMATHLLADLGP